MSNCIPPPHHVLQAHGVPQVFPLAEALSPTEEKKLLGPSTSDKSLLVMATYAGATRPPRRGEWYLSGAVIGAYRAAADLTSEYPIARLVAASVIQPPPVYRIVRTLT